MKNLYARFVLFLIGPALALSSQRTINAVAANVGVALKPGEGTAEILSHLSKSIVAAPLGKLSISRRIRRSCAQS